MPSPEDIELLGQKREAVFTELEGIRVEAGEPIYRLERHRRIHELDWPGQRNLQVPLFEKARESGLLSEIAKFTGRELSPIYVYTDDDIFKHQSASIEGDLPDSPQSWPSLEEWKEAFGPGWKANLLPPVLREDETWDLGLVISCTKDTIDMMRKPQRFDVGAWVTVSTDEVVTINGSKQEYNGPLQVDRKMRNALERAFEYPKYPEQRSIRMAPWVRQMRLKASV